MDTPYGILKEKANEALKNAYASGADVVVVGNVLEEQPELYTELCKL